MRNKKLQLTKQRKIARERIAHLFDLAGTKFLEGRKDLANRYVYLARKIAMKVNVKISPVLKRKFCKHCYHFLYPGKNLRVRTKDGKVIYYCLDCKKFMRFPYIKEKKAKRN